MIQIGIGDGTGSQDTLREELFGIIYLNRRIDR